jgi:hypothetical protein
MNRSQKASTVLKASKPVTAPVIVSPTLPIPPRAY